MIINVCAVAVAVAVRRKYDRKIFASFTSVYGECEYRAHVLLHWPPRLWVWLCRPEAANLNDSSCGGVSHRYPNVIASVEI